MKLFLSSLAVSEMQRDAFVRLVGKPAGEIKLALIENAADPEGNVRPGWVDENRAMIESNGFDVEIVDLRKYKHKPAELRDKLASKDVIWLGGGNTFYLRWILRETGADHIITKLVKDGKVYGGGSAGAIMAGPTLKYFETADDPADAPKLILDGLHLTDKVIVPHMDNPKFKAIIGKINENLRADGYQTVPLGDAQAFIVNGNEDKII